MLQLLFLDESPTATPSTSTSPAPLPGGNPSTAVLTWGEALAALGITAAVILLIGLGLLLTRRTASVRSWIALSLVAGLVLFCVLAFAIDDPSARSTLIGALGAAVGSVIAFYFTSKATEQTHQLLAATMGTESIPDLSNLSEAKAKERLGTTSLQLVTALDSPAPDNLTVTKQDPIAGTTAPKGASVFVTYG